MRWAWGPYNFPAERTPDAMRERDVAIIEHLSCLEESHYPPRSTSAGEPPLRGCTAKVVPDECAKLYPARKGRCIRPIGAVPRGVTPGFVTDCDGKHAFCPWKVADAAPGQRVQVSHDRRAPQVFASFGPREAILAFLASAITTLAAHPEPRIAAAARYYAPQSLHEHIAGITADAPGEAAALELAQHIRVIAASVKPWQKEAR